MPAMLLNDFTAVLAARDVQCLSSMVSSFAWRLGFDRFCAIAIRDRVANETEFKDINNTPAAYLDLWRDPREARRDPVMQHCKTSSQPIIWTQETYAAASCGDKWETQAAYGYKTGIALALHLPRGFHFFIGVDRDQDLPSNSGEITRLVAELQLFAVTAHEAAHRLLLAHSDKDVVQPLTPREIECLRWTMEGKTAWEVGMILSISEQTANRHVSNATSKLGCTNKHHAVLRALHFGLIR